MDQFSVGHSRRTFLRGVGFGAIGLTGLAALGACGDSGGTSGSASDALAKIKARGYLLYGTNGERPYNYTDPDGTLTGSEIDIARQVAKSLGIDEVQGVAMNFDSFIPAIQAGRIDTCQPIFVKPERCKVLKFATPHLKEGQSCIVPSGNPKGIKGWDDILAKDVQVGLVAGTTPNEIAKNIKVPDKRITRFPDTTALTAGMKSGRVDAIVEASSTLRLIAQELPESKFERVQAWAAPSAGDVTIDFYASFPFHASAAALRDAFDAELQKLVSGAGILGITGKYGFTEDDLPGDGAPSLDELCSG